MKDDNLKERIMDKIMDRAESILETKAKTFAALLKYEIAVANTELAMNTTAHGYNFQFISPAYADAVTLGQATRMNGRLTMTLTIPKHAFKSASDKEIEFFKTYILANTIKKMQNTV